MKWNTNELLQLREIIGVCGAEALARYMTQLQFHEKTDAVTPEVTDAANDLGWVRPGTWQFTEAGWFAADSCREYVFWIDRGRRLPFAEEAPDLVSESLTGKSVLEIGSGSGVNLMSLAPVAAEVVGVEPVAAYRQIGALLAEVEGLGSIRAESGQAEALPFQDASFDTVLCVTAHQYFDIPPAFREIARVLKPGGEAVIIGGTLGGYAKGSARSLFGRDGLSGLKNYVLTVTNTLGCMTLGRRVLVGRSKWSTAYPVYPSRGAMVRMLAGAGLALHRPLRRIGTETCFRARKPA